MGLLRRLLGRDGGDDRAEAADGGTAAGGTAAGGAAEPFDPATADEEERAHELELARFDQERIDDLIRRQQRYADRSWTPAAQGGDRRADDADVPER